MTREEFKEMMNNTRNPETIVDMFLNGEEVIDDHTNDAGSFEALVFFRDPDKGIAGGCANATYYCLNEIYVSQEDNKLHLSKCSIGGTVKGSLNEDSIRMYNESCTFDGGKISKVIFRDGTILNAEEYH